MHILGQVDSAQALQGCTIKSLGTQRNPIDASRSVTGE
jgi:hypothetical protein